MTRRVAAVLVAAAVALAASAPPAWAHATLERSTPARGAVLERPPGDVRLDFDEPVEAAFGAVRVYDGGGERVRTGTLRRIGGGSAVAVSLPARLADGAYTVTYRVVSADGHPVAGGLTFRVGDAVAAPRSDVAALLARESAGPVTRAALGVARGLGYLAIAAAIGGLVFQVLCRRDAPVGPLVAGGIALGVAAGATALVLQAAVAGGTSAWQALDPPVLRDVLDTRSGAMLGLRLAAWIALAALLAIRRPRAAVLPAAVVVAGPALAGHAAAQSPAWLLAPLDVIHTGAAAVWIGGLLALLVASPGLSRSNRALTVRRFSAVALWSVLAIVATGAVQAAVHLDWSLSPLADSGFGRSLLVKSALLAALVAIGAVHRRRIIPALRDAPRSASRMLRRGLRAEVVLVLGVLAATAVLAGSPPPRAAAGAQPAGPFSADVAIGPQRLQLTVDPALAGPNELHVYLLDARTGAPFTGSRELRVRAALPVERIGPLPLEAHRAGPGHWVVTGAPLAPAGAWRVTVANRVSDFDEYEARVEVPVR